ncbi:hypothetical protein [Zhongshania arctica]|uniref:Uncharacterized protein n=1 Tax=Zhongshania arctica TaxID=3238302 RepID=A0ABV3TXM1_9GAMM
MRSTFLWKSKSATYTAFITMTLFTSTLVIVPANASPSFSNGHEKIERALERAQNGNVDAIWTQHNVLVIAIAKDHFNAKNYAKSVCGFLLTNGFAKAKTKIVITDKDVLASKNQWSQLAERDCK